MKDELEIVPVYVIDSSTLIQAHRSYYAFDICPAFWKALACHQSENHIETIDRVRDEIGRGKIDDDLKRWIAQIPDEFYYSTDEDKIRQAFGDIITWVQSEKNFFPEVKAAFAKDTDGWVVAYAIAKNRTVVSQEVFAEGVKKNVPIPNICKAFNVEHIDTFKFLRKLNIRFE